MFFAPWSSENLVDKLITKKIRNENFQIALLDAKKSLLKAYKIEPILYILDVVDIIQNIKTRKIVSKKILENQKILQIDAEINKVLKNTKKPSFSNNENFSKEKNPSQNV